MQHLRLSHGLSEGGKEVLICGQGACPRTFHSFRGFRGHLRSHLKPDLPDNQEQFTGNDRDSDSSEEGFSVYNSDNDDVDQGQGINEDDSILSAENLNRQCAKVISKFSANSANSGKVVNDMVESTSLIVGDVVKSASATVKAVFLKHKLPLESEAYEEIQTHFAMLEKPFENLNSEYKRMKYCVSLGLVEPQEIKLGIRYDSRLNKITKQYEQIAIEDTFVYIPILESLKQLLSHKDILHFVTHDHRSTDDIMRDYCDGAQFKKKTLFNEDANALQIHCFYDDFETVNPIGSKTKIHKLGAFYFILKNLPPKYNSSLSSINLVALWYAEDVKKYGYNAILKHIVKDINILSSVGITLSNGIVKRGTITQISADNLGANALFGFVQSLSANYYCRLCITSKEEAQNLLKEVLMEMRTRQTYEQHLEEAETESTLSHVFGVKQ